MKVGENIHSEREKKMSLLDNMKDILQDKEDMEALVDRDKLQEKGIRLKETLNGDPTYVNTLSANLDFFGSSSLLFKGFIYNDDHECEFNDPIEHHKAPFKMFAKALSEDPEMAIKNLLYLRDIRGGHGFRDTPRGILQTWLETIQDSKGKLQSAIPGFESNEYDYLLIAGIISMLPKYGRWDDVFAMYGLQRDGKSIIDIDKLILQMIVNAMQAEDMLVYKWLPSENASSKKTKAVARKIRKGLGLDSKEYRQILSAGRKAGNVLEVKLTNKDYDGIDYAKIPGRALKKYQAAFQRNDHDNYQSFLKGLADGNVKAKSETSWPHEIVRQMRYNPDESRVSLLQGYWQSFTRKPSKINTIVVRDGSASMYWGDFKNQPIDIADAVALLSSELMPGKFHNKFITFSSKPQLVDLTECAGDLGESLRTLREYQDVSNTDLNAVFELILKASKGLPEEEQIDRILVISDMQFDPTESNVPVYEKVKAKFRKKGVKLPEVIFWSVDVLGTPTFPSIDTDNVKFVSGFSNQILMDVIAGEDIGDAYTYMVETLMKYDDDVKRILYACADKLKGSLREDSQPESPSSNEVIVIGGNND